jgi:hypothetical protein
MRWGAGRGGPGRPHHQVAWPRTGPAPTGGVGPWWLTSPSPSGYFCLPAKYEFLDIFLELLVFRNMVS